jgi:DNA-binding NarL/FixJ family response regulator
VGDIKELSAKQREVLELLMQGADVKKVLGIQDNTLRRHINAIARAWGIDCRDWNVRVRIAYLEGVRRGLIALY